MAVAIAFREPNAKTHISQNSTCCVTSQHDTTRYLANAIWHRKKWRAACVALVGQHGATGATRTTRRAVVSCRDVTQQVKFGLYRPIDQIEYYLQKKPTIMAIFAYQSVEMSSLSIWKQLFVGIEIFHHNNFLKKFVDNCLVRKVRSSWLAWCGRVKWSV